MSNESWIPTKYIAPCCGSIIFSKWSGHFVMCKCGKQFVDQTEHYTRHTTGLEIYIEDTEEGLE